MSIISRRIGSVLFGLALLTASAWAGPSTIQGEVKGPDGKAVKGAEVTMAPKGAKTATNSVKTDSQGRFAFKSVDVGSYNLQVSAKGLASTTAEDVRTRAGGAIGVNFILKTQTGTAAAGPAAKQKAKHMVWMPAETGSNLGGRWVEVSDTTGQAGPSVNNLQRGSGSAITGMQGGPGGSGGSNTGSGGGR